MQKRFLSSQLYFSTSHCNLITDVNALKSIIFCMDFQAYMYCSAQIRSKPSFMFCCGEKQVRALYKLRKELNFSELNARCIVSWTKLENHFGP